eukprot:534600_1
MSSHCIECGRTHLEQINHYCTKCLFKIINNSLSLLNKTPKCSIPFNLSSTITLNKMLLPRYQLQSKQDRNHINRMNIFLFDGYIRQIICPQNINIVPSELSEIIKVFYQTDYFTEIECNECDGSGIKHIDCNGSERFQLCIFCDNGIMYYRQDMVIKSKKCTFCAINNNIQYDPCDGSGHSNVSTSCTKCYNGKIVRLDFKKLIKTQDYCHICNEYYPNNMIIYWSGCYHTFCIQCLTSKYVESEIRSDKIPMCPLKNCIHELIEQDMECYFDISIDCWYDFWDLQKLKQTVFECCICKQLHANQKLLMFSACGHKYTRLCGREYILNLINNMNIPCCCECGTDITMNEIQMICGDEYVNLINNFNNKNKFKSLITKKYINIYGSSQILNITNHSLHCNDRQLEDKIINFLSLTSIKVKDIEYLNIVLNSKTSCVPLFQLSLKNEYIAQSISVEIWNLTKNVLHQQWSVAFCDVYNNQQNNNTNKRYYYNHQMYNNTRGFGSNFNGYTQQQIAQYNQFYCVSASANNSNKYNKNNYYANKNMRNNINYANYYQQGTYYQNNYQYQ